MDIPDKEGFTYRQRLRTAYPDDPMLHETVPWGLDHVWAYWGDLARTNGSGFSSIQPLTYPTLESWARVKEAHLSPFRAELLIRIDGLFRKIWSENSKRKDEEE